MTVPEEGLRHWQLQNCLYMYRIGTAQEMQVVVIARFTRATL